MEDTYVILFPYFFYIVNFQSKEVDFVFVNNFLFQITDVICQIKKGIR